MGFVRVELGGEEGQAWGGEGQRSGCKVNKKNLFSIKEKKLAKNVDHKVKEIS